MTLNEELFHRRHQAVGRGVATATPVFADRAENAEIWDVNGQRYVDFAGGIAVLNVGHRHPKVIAAVREQLDRFTHTAFQVMAYEPYVELAERLNAIAPVEGAAKTVLFTTGAEATENAVKIARVATGRSAVIAFTGGFHGRTLMASAMTGKVSPYKQQFGPLPAEVFHAPFPSDEAGISLEESLRALEFIFAADVAPNRVAAIIVEPVQGEGGFHVASTAFLRALRAICDQHGILLVADEVQTGFARTGRMFAVEHSGVKPDLLAIAKSLAGGFPLSAVVGRAEVIDSVDPGGLGGTYGGSPIACAAALAVFDIIAEEDLLDRAAVIGERLRERIGTWGRRNDLRPISVPRGLGAMVAFDIYREGGTSDPDGAVAKEVIARSLDAGLIILNCGATGGTIRILVPLTAPLSVIDEGLDRLERALVITPDAK